MHLGHALIYKEANDDEDLSDLKDTKLITGTEAAVLVNFKNLSQPPIVYGWVMKSMFVIFSFFHLVDFLIIKFKCYLFISLIYCLI